MERFIEEFEGREGQERYYNSIEDILHDMTQAEDVGLPWIYFIKVYENAFETYRIDIRAGLPGIQSLKAEKPEYYQAVLKFEEEVTATFGNAISPELYNKLISLSMMILKVAEFVTSKKCKKDLKSFNDSIMFLQKAKKKYKLPMEFYTYMSVIFLWEDLKIKYEYKKKSKKDKVKAELEVKQWMDVLRNFFLKKFTEIVKMIYRGSEIKLKVKEFAIKERHVYYHYKEDNIVGTYSLDFFDKDGKALTIILTGDKRSGKTIGSLKIIESALAQGFSVVIFGEDIRKELRWANFPLDRTFPNLYELLEKQKQRPRGLPIKIYRSNPNPDYPIEKDVKNFKGSVWQWNRFRGVYIFEDDIERIMRSFGNWRNNDKKKKVIAVFNEAGEFVPSNPTKGKWEFVQYVKFWFTHIGGWKIPVILNTQWIKKIDKNARQVDVIITSYLSNVDDRKMIAEMSGDKRHAVWLGDQNLKPNNYFWMFRRNKAAKIKFLVTKCMPESSTDKTLDELFAEHRLNGDNYKETEGRGGIESERNYIHV